MIGYYFLVGDLFDEGLWSNSVEFNSTIQRFHSLFAVPQNTFLYVVPGNHDMGFHYCTTVLYIYKSYEYLTQQKMNLNYHFCFLQGSHRI